MLCFALLTCTVVHYTTSIHFPMKLTMGLVRTSPSIPPFKTPLKPSHTLTLTPTHPTPPPPTTAAAAMMLSVVLALFLPCAGMTVILLIYAFLLCYAGVHHRQPDPPVKPVTQTGLSPTELQKLPITTGKDLVLQTECAVCLDDVEPEQLARVLPGCNHGFHLQCADTWLSKNPVCPVCRNALGAGFFAPPEEISPC